MIWTEYDTANRPETTTIQDTSGNLLYRTTLNYDDLEHVGSLKENVAGAEYATSYSYDWDDRATEIRYGDSAHRVRYGYDGQGRLQTRRVTNGNADQTSTYSYLGSSVAIPGLSTVSSTNLVSGISQPLVSFAYGYAGDTDNIVSETRTGGSYAGTTTYEYDSLGQLTRVNDSAEGTTRVYRYDLGGNMTGQTKYAYTTGTPGEALLDVVYSYADANWKDRLTGSTESAIGSYDAIGNLTSYNGWVYEWEAGRQLKRQVQNGETDVRYEYDQNGMRVRKTVNGIATNYTYNGTRLVHLTTGGDSLHFYYDGQGKPALVSHNGVTYSYLYNLQGDVIGLVDSAGNLVVEYKYNAWGSIIGRAGSLSETLGKLNPFRYRGYVYDEETWMYWLKSRYYYPELSRFISADVVIGKIGSVNGHNLYAYCGNEPVTLLDDTGYLWKGIFHNAVQEHIVSNNEGIVMEVPVRLWWTMGRIDLYDTHSHECWEIKPASRYWIRKVIVQLGAYLTGKIDLSASRFAQVAYDGEQLQTGSPRFSGTFLYTTELGTYEIRYASVEQGVIIYTYARVEDEKERSLKKSIIAGLATALAAAALGTLMGGGGKDDLCYDYIQ